MEMLAASDCWQSAVSGYRSFSERFHKGTQEELYGAQLRTKQTERERSVVWIYSSIACQQYAAS